MRFGVPVFVTLLPLTLSAQERASDRWRFLDTSSTRTTDDPRRVPLPPERPGTPKPVLVVQGGRIFDGTGAPAREGTLVIIGNRISRIVPAGSTDWPRDARVVNAAGKTVMPGLVDLHTHLSYTEPGVATSRATDPADAALRGAERLRYYVESGITSVRDVGSFGNVAIILKDWVSGNRIPGPRVFAAGRLIVGHGGHGAGVTGSRVASGTADWRDAVRENFDNGADLIKIASHFSKDEVAAAVEEAHALGLRVTCDCEAFYVDWAVDAGVDMIEHPLPRSDQAIRKMAEKGVASDPTLIPYDIIFDQSGGYWGSTSRRFTFSKEANLDMMRRLKRAGVKMGVGTDLVTNWFRFLPAPYLQELQHFQAIGYTPAEVLTIATKTSAELLDMGDKLGTLTVGKLADVLIVRGRPDQSLEDIVNVHTVIRDGHVVVEDGRVVTPRHTPVPMPSPRTTRSDATRGGHGDSSAPSM
jgi:imidazolonepropionase-like amidohydrolase